MLQNKEKLAGALIPGSTGILYQFPFRVLYQALDHLFGECSVNLQIDDTFLDTLSFRPDFKCGEGSESFENLKIFLVYMHEQFHLRHLSSSPFGFFLWILQSREYVYAMKWLQKWGERVPVESVTPKLPLSENHAKDPEIASLGRLKRTFSLFLDLFRYQQLLPRLEAIDVVLPEAFAEVQSFFAGVLGIPDAYPRISTVDSVDTPLAISGVNGQAIIEGFARCNEYLTMVELGCPVSVLNNYILLNAHGIYNVAIREVEKALSIRPPQSHLVTAGLADWALQAPILPFLLRDREEISIEELLPNLRFMRILQAFHRHGLTLDGLGFFESRVENIVFGTLGWISPTQLAEYTSLLEHPSHLPSQVQLNVQKLKLAARLRLEKNAGLCTPKVDPSANALRTGFSIFSDGSIVGTGRLFDVENWFDLLTLLLDDIIIDSVWIHKSLDRACWYADHILRLLHGDLTGSQLVLRKLRSLFGMEIAGILASEQPWSETSDNLNYDLPE